MASTLDYHVQWAIVREPVDGKIPLSEGNRVFGEQWHYEGDHSLGGYVIRYLEMGKSRRQLLTMLLRGRY